MGLLQQLRGINIKKYLYEFETLVNNSNRKERVQKNQ